MALINSNIRRILRILQCLTIQLSKWQCNSLILSLGTHALLAASFYLECAGYELDQRLEIMMHFSLSSSSFPPLFLLLYAFFKLDAPRNDCTLIIIATKERCTYKLGNVPTQTDRLEVWAGRGSNLRVLKQLFMPLEQDLLPPTHVNKDCDV